MSLSITRTASTGELLKQINEKGAGFFFTESERLKLLRPQGIRSLCVRLLAKNILLEQMGTGCTYQDLSFENDVNGAPVLKFRNPARFDEWKDGRFQRIFVSFSHTRSRVGVFMIFE